MMQLPNVNITFEEENHLYKTESGICLPSVTTLMRFMSRELYDGIPMQTLAQAAERGTRVHHQTELLDLYGYRETDEETEGYMLAYEKFKADHQPVFYGVEWRGCHKALGYAGTIDRVAWLPIEGAPIEIDEVIVIDLKTTRNFHAVMLEAQVAAYAEILKSWGVKVRANYGLQLLPDATYRLERLNHQRGYKTFLHCLAIHNAMAEERGA